MRKCNFPPIHALLIIYDLVDRGAIIIRIHSKKENATIYWLISVVCEEHLFLKILGCVSNQKAEKKKEEYFKALGQLKNIYMKGKGRGGGEGGTGGGKRIMRRRGGGGG